MIGDFSLTAPFSRCLVFSFWYSHFLKPIVITRNGTDGRTESGSKHMLAIALALTLSAEPFDLMQWNKERLQTQRIGLGVLGTWAVGNMAVGAVGAGLATDERVRWFHLGNLLWNTVNLTLATVGLVSDWNTDASIFNAKDSLKASSSTVTIYGVNAGIDLGYLATGAFFWQRGSTMHDARMVGFGQALVLQGAFLAVFDVVMAVFHGSLNSKLFDAAQIWPP
jgi:hypothetical protein